MLGRAGEALRMVGDPTVAKSFSLGRERYHQLLNISAAPGNQQLPLLRALPWVRFNEVIDHDITDRGGFSFALSEFTYLLETIANHRGPAILGYFKHLDLSFSFRADASFDPKERVLRLNLGLVLLLNELERTYKWLESVVLRLAGGAAPKDFAHSSAPPDARSELRAFKSAAQGLSVSGKLGQATALGRVTLRLLIAHELAHMVDAAESVDARTSFRRGVWIDYRDALQYGIGAGWLNPERWPPLQRQALPEAMACSWADEFVADGIGFDIASRAQPPAGIPVSLYFEYLQVAVELFFRSMVLVYGNDFSYESHPSAMLRSAMIKAGRKDSRMEWRQFLENQWRSGWVAGELLDPVLRSLLAKSTNAR